MRNAIVFGLASSFVIALVACGGAPPPAATAPESPGAVAAPVEPGSVEEAQRQIDDARDALDGRTKFQDSTQSTTPRVTEPTTAAESRAPQCVTPCRAIASMRRAVTALCRMAGDTDARCTDAKKTLETSETRIASCHC